MIFSQISSIPSLFSCHWKPFFFALKVYLHFVEKKEKEKGKEESKTKEKEEEEEEKRFDKLVKYQIISSFFVNCDFISGNSFHDQFLRIVLATDQNEVHCS